MYIFLKISCPLGFTENLYIFKVSGLLSCCSYDLDMLSMFILPVFSNQNIQSVLDRIKPINVLRVYENFYANRKTLYKDFKGDQNSYVYLIVNKLNGKIYVGSSRSMKNRASNYFNLAHLASQKSRPISSAMLKYGLVNFALIVIEQVDNRLHNLEVRETYWIKYLKPNYNATKDAARNIGASHTWETKLALSIKKSFGAVYIYNEFKQLLVIAPSVTHIALLLGSKPISTSIKRAIKEGFLFRSTWYLTQEPFNIDDKPLIEVGTEAYTDLINHMKSKKHIRKAIFVFKDGKFICKYDGVMVVAKALKISHNIVKECIVNNTTHKGLGFSYHRV